jgi:hypothetical protein
MSREEWNARQRVGQITDARGRSVSQVDPVMMHLLRQPGGIPPEVLRDMAQQIGIGMTRANRLAFWGSVASIVCCGIALAIGLTRLSAGSITFRRFLTTMVPFTSIWIAPFGFWIGTRNARSERTTRTMLEHLRCPHCGYDIRGLPTAPEDGATICPECGCAWRLDDSQADESHRSADSDRSRTAGSHKGKDNGSG